MRRKQQPQDSLELFLDAVCNMFGAFLFLLLFVVVLLQTTRREQLEKRAQAPSYNELKALTIERDALKEEWREAFEQSRELAAIQEHLFSPEIAALLEQTLQTVEEQQEIAQKNAALKAEIEARNSAVVVASQNLARLQEEIETKRKRLKELDRESEKRVEAQTRQTSPPQLHFSDKDEFPVVVKYGRLYLWKRLNDRDPLSDPVFNDEDFYVVERDKSGALVEPKPNAGVDLNGAPEKIDRELTARFADVKASRFKIAFVVSPDSFAEFNVARNFFKERGYDVRILIGESGERVYDRGGDACEAQ